MWLIDNNRRVSTRLTTGGRSFSSAWTPDGQRLVMVASGSSRDRVGGREYRVVLNRFEEFERLVPINH